MVRKVYLLLGSNLGDREKNLEKALEMLDERRIYPIKRSSIYETEPWGVKEQPLFLNMAVEVETELMPLDLLITLKDIEKSMGRTYRERYGPRLIDIDIIFYNYMVIDIPELKIPHPFMHERRFVLEPLMEIAPHMRHPLLGLTVEEMIGRFKDGDK